MFDSTAFERDGYALTRPLLSPDKIAATIKLLEGQRNAEGGPRRGGLRDVMNNLPAVRSIANHPAVRNIVEQVIGGQAFVVRCTLFDKTEASNWKVPWHQDVTIAVKERRETKGYGPWSVKAGAVHVQPPSEVLERMVTVRVHLDDCPAANGALRVMPGTHLLGRLNQHHVDKYVDEAFAVCCAASAGEALVMRPLLIHASSASAQPGHRRVLHFDFAADSLPEGLEWNMPSYGDSRPEAETWQPAA